MKARLEMRLVVDSIPDPNYIFPQVLIAAALPDINPETLTSTAVTALFSEMQQDYLQREQKIPDNCTGLNAESQAIMAQLLGLLQAGKLKLNHFTQTTLENNSKTLILNYEIPKGTLILNYEIPKG